MRVFALGGAGQFGKTTTQRLARSDVVTEIAVAGRNIEAAKSAAAELGNKATAVQVDLVNIERLASLAEGYDVFVNTAGPEYEAVLPALRAAIKARVNYCDLCAYGPTTEKALDLDSAAKDSGITAIMGIGLAGLSNLRMMHAARQLDRTEELRFCIFQVVSMYGESPAAVLSQWRKAGHADASWQFMMKLVAGKVRLYRNGGWVDVDPSKETIHTTLPLGGEVSLVPYPGPESLTIPRALPGISSVSNLYGMFPSELNGVYCGLGRRIADGEIDESEAAIALFEHLDAHPMDRSVVVKGCETGWTDWVEAIGTRRGERVLYKGWAVGGWDSTSGPLAAAALKLLRGEISMKGVLPPEACLDPVPFFREVAKTDGVEPPGGKYLEETFETLP